MGKRRDERVSREGNGKLYHHSIMLEAGAYNALGYSFCDMIISSRSEQLLVCYMLVLSVLYYYVVLTYTLVHNNLLSSALFFFYLPALDWTVRYCLINV